MDDRHIHAQYLMVRETSLDMLRVSKQLLRVSGANQARMFSAEARVASQKLNESFHTFDPELVAIIEKEKERQAKTISLIASENFAPRFVCDALSTVMTNKYSEGYPGARYYGGNEYIDQVERMCQERALAAFGLNPEEWGVNVQSLSGSPANFQAYHAVCNPGDRILALDLPHGGHLSHGYQLPNKKISAVSSFYETFVYRLSEDGYINYPEMRFMAERVRPKVIVAGFSAYPRGLDYKAFREAADASGAYLLADMAHVSGLVAAGQAPSPFEYCDIVTTTTHKTLRGPRGAMIFYRKGLKPSTDPKKPATPYGLEEKINASVFPGLQGGPHNHTITALATALKAVATPEYKEYQTQVVRNAKALANGLLEEKFDLVTGGTENHLMLVDLRSKGVTGSKFEAMCDAVSISVNKNTIAADKSALSPSGVRLGSPAMTSRGLDEADFKQVAKFISRTADVAKEVQQFAGSPKLVDFKAQLNAKTELAAVKELREEIEAFAKKFPTIAQ